MIRNLIISVALFGMVGPVLGKETPELALRQKAEVSDRIFVGRVLRIERPEGVDGVRAFAVFEVTDAVKGVDVDERVNFVFRGAIPESDPDCCLVGKSYLVFAVDGAQQFYLQDGQIGGSIAHRGNFSSASNGRFSTYRVESSVVKGWSKEGSITDVRLEVVLRAVADEISGCEMRGS